MTPTGKDVDFKARYVNEGLLVERMMTAPEEYYRGWNAAYADEGWDDNASDEWKAGYSEARDLQYMDMRFDE